MEKFCKKVSGCYYPFHSTRLQYLSFQSWGCIGVVFLPILSSPVFWDTLKNCSNNGADKNAEELLYKLNVLCNCVVYYHYIKTDTIKSFLSNEFKQRWNVGSFLKVNTKQCKFLLSQQMLGRIAIVINSKVLLITLKVGDFVLVWFFFSIWQKDREHGYLRKKKWLDKHDQRWGSTQGTT